MKRHWPTIETLYALGLALVILGHSHSSDWSTFEGTWLVPLIQFIYLFHMAMFFGIAGFLFQNSESRARLGYRKWLSDKALRLLVPYCFWSLLALAPKYFFEHHSFAGLTPAYILTSLFCPRQNIWGHFWFLPVLFLAYALFGLLPRFPNRQRPPALLLAVVALATGCYFLPIRIEWLGLADLRNSLAFFALGMLARSQSERLADNFAIGGGISRIVLPALALALFALGFGLRENAQASRLVALPVAILLIAACVSLAAVLPTNSIVSWLARHNFTIYLFSWMFQAVVMELCSRLRCPWTVTTPAMFAVGFIGPIAMILVLERIPWLRRPLLRRLFGGSPT